MDRTIASSLRLKSLLEYLLHCKCASLQLCVQGLSLSDNLKYVRSNRTQKN